MANWITLSRIFFAPIFLMLFINGVENQNIAPLLAALVTLILIEISDGIDGAVARHLKQVTDLGKFLDPIADSLSRLTIFLAFLLTGLIPFWMFLIFLYRDILVSGVRLFVMKEGTVLSARISGKLKAIFQAIGSFAVLAVVISDTLGVTSIAEKSSIYIMLFPALFTAWSCWDYISGSWGAIKKNMEPIG